MPHPDILRRIAPLARGMRCFTSRPASRHQPVPAPSRSPTASQLAGLWLPYRPLVGHPLVPFLDGLENCSPADLTFQWTRLPAGKNAAGGEAVGSGRQYTPSEQDQGRRLRVEASLPGAVLLFSVFTASWPRPSRRLQSGSRCSCSSLPSTEPPAQAAARRRS